MGVVRCFCTGFCGACHAVEIVALATAGVLLLITVASSASGVVVESLTLKQKAQVKFVPLQVQKSETLRRGPAERSLLRRLPQKGIDGCVQVDAFLARLFTAEPPPKSKHAQELRPHHQ